MLNRDIDKPSLNRLTKFILAASVVCSSWTTEAAAASQSYISLPTPDYTWNGGKTHPGTNSWNTSSNWSPQQVPGPNTTVLVEGAGSYADFHDFFDIAPGVPFPSSLYFGNAGGTGTLIIKDGATVNNSDNTTYTTFLTYFGFFNAPPSTGNLYVIGATLNTDSLEVPNYAFASTGNMVIENGGVVRSGIVNIGNPQGGFGNVTVDKSQWIIGGTAGVVGIGGNGTAEVHIKNQGEVTSNMVYLAHGGFGTGNAAVDLNDASSWTINNKLYIGVGTDAFGLTGTNHATLNIFTDSIIDVGEETLIAAKVCNNNCNIDSEGVLNLGNQTSLNGGKGMLITQKLTAGTGTTTVNADGGILKAKANAADFINGFAANEFNIMAGGLTIDSASYTIATNNNILSGAGKVTKLGDGRLTLNGNNTYTGSTEVQEGSLIIGGTVPGAVIVSNNVNSGKAGTLILNGTNTAANSATVKAQGRLQGNGSIGNTTVQATGIIAPGNSVGTITVNGNYVQQTGSIYEVELGNSGNLADLIDITGTAVIEDGAKIQVINGQNIIFGTTYKVLSAVGGVTGKYDALAPMDSYPLLDFAVTYGEDDGSYTVDNSQSAHHVSLRFARNQTAFHELAATPNQAAAGAGAESLGAGHAVFDSLAGLLTAQTIQAAYDSLSGEAYASMIGVLMDESRFARNAAIDRMTGMQLDHEDKDNSKGSNYWVQGFGNWGRNKGNYNASSLDNHSNGVFIGADSDSNRDLRLGVLGGYSHTTMDVDKHLAKFKSDDYHLGLYASRQLEDLSLSLGGVYSRHNIDSNRIVYLSTTNEQLGANYHGHTMQGFAEAGYKLINLTRGQIDPFIQGAYVNTNVGRFIEQPGITALIGNKKSQDITYSTLGARLNSRLTQSENINWNGHAVLGWRHAYNGINPNAVLNFDGGTAFNVIGAPLAKDSLMIDAGLAGTQNRNNPWQVKLAYSGQLAKQVKDNGIRGELNWQFD